MCKFSKILGWAEDPWRSACTSDIFNEYIQKINQKSFYFLNFGAKRRIYFLTFLIYFLKNQAGEKNPFIFWIFSKNKTISSHFRSKNAKNRFIFWFIFWKTSFWKSVIFFENHQNLKNITGMEQSGVKSNAELWTNWIQPAVR